VAMRLISRIGARFGRRGPKRGSVVITTPPAELHSAPVAIAADLLRWAGFNVVELGANTPAAALSQTLATVPDLLAVAMACSTDASAASARRVIVHLRRAIPGVTVLVGGSAIADAAEALRLGADGFSGRRGDDLVRAIEEVTATATH
jgi:methanogenic corrinoid protein MtbC1